MRAERTIELAAPPQRVNDVAMDPDHLDDWVTIHDHLEDAPDGQLERGSTMTQCLKLAGRKFKVRWTVVENDPCKRVVWEGHGPVASEAKVIYEFEPHGEGTRFSYANEYKLPGGPLGRIAGRGVARMTEKALDDSLRKFKELVD